MSVKAQVKAVRNMRIRNLFGDGWSQGELAKKEGIDQGTVSRILRKRQTCDRGDVRLYSKEEIAAVTDRPFVGNETPDLELALLHMVKELLDPPLQVLGELVKLSASGVRRRLAHVRLQEDPLNSRINRAWDILRGKEDQEAPRLLDPPMTDGDVQVRQLPKVCFTEVQVRTMRLNLAYGFQSYQNLLKETRVCEATLLKALWGEGNIYGEIPFMFQAPKECILGILEREGLQEDITEGCESLPIEAEVAEAFPDISEDREDMPSEIEMPDPGPLDPGGEPADGECREIARDEARKDRESQGRFSRFLGVIGDIFHLGWWQ